MDRGRALIKRDPAGEGGGQWTPGESEKKGKKRGGKKRHNSDRGTGKARYVRD